MSDQTTVTVQVDKFGRLILRHLLSDRPFVLYICDASECTLSGSV